MSLPVSIYLCMWQASPRRSPLLHFDHLAYMVDQAVSVTPPSMTWEVWYWRPGHRELAVTLEQQYVDLWMQLTFSRLFLRCLFSMQYPSPLSWRAKIATELPRKNISKAMFGRASDGSDDIASRRAFGRPKNIWIHWLHATDKQPEINSGYREMTFAKFIFS